MIKKSIYIAIALLGSLWVASCSDDDFIPGNPVMELKNLGADAFFGDSLPFTIKASDTNVPLSTLKAQLYYGDEKVSEAVIRTKDSGSDYTGKIFVPYLPNVINGTATLKYVLQNINQTYSEVLEKKVMLVRPDFPYLTLVTSEGDYRMERAEMYQYNLTTKLPQKVKGYIKTPKVGANGNELTFGWENGVMVEGTMDNITFSNSKAGKYTIAFNSLTYEASPFVKLLVNGVEMEMVDDNNYKVDLTLKPGDMVTFSGIPEFEEWTADKDFLQANEDGTYKFLPLEGTYRLTASFTHKYVFVEAMNGSSYATLQTNGTGAIWIIGTGIGKPSVGSNEVGWTTSKALCMSQITAKKYQVTVVAGKSVNATDIGFKFFHQKDWGGEFKSDAITTDGEIVGIGDGTGGHDNGNLYLKTGKTLIAGHIYKFVIDVTAGITKAKLIVTDEGVQPVEIKNMSLNGTKLNSTDGDTYSGNINMTQNEVINTVGLGDLTAWWLNPDYLELNEDGELVFLPMSGSYNVIANYTQKTFKLIRMNGANEATLGIDGHGAVWIMGWGVGSPSMDQQFGWTPGVAYCMPEIAPKVYRFTCTAGPEKNSSLGDRIRFDYVSMKFFFQNGWGEELAGDTNGMTMAAGTDAFIKQPGNFELVSNLEQGATYVITVDLTAGNNKGILSFVEK